MALVGCAFWRRVIVFNYLVGDGYSVPHDVGFSRVSTKPRKSLQLWNASTPIAGRNAHHRDLQQSRALHPDVALRVHPGPARLSTARGRRRAGDPVGRRSLWPTADGTLARQAPCISITICSLARTGTTHSGVSVNQVSRDIPERLRPEYSPVPTRAPARYSSFSWLEPPVARQAGGPARAGTQFQTLVRGRRDVARMGERPDRELRATAQRHCEEIAHPQLAYSGQPTIVLVTGTAKKYVTH